MTADGSTGGGADKRGHVRFAIHLPVKVALFTSPRVVREGSHSMRAAREGSSPSIRAAREGSLPSMRAAREVSTAPMRPAGEAWGSQSAMRAARPAHAFDGLAVDVSERGMKLEVSGASLKALLDSSDPLVRLEVTLAHAQLGHVGALTGHVQWRGPGADRNSWTVGARFDAPIPAHVLSQILRYGATAARGTNALPALGLGVVALLVAIGWYRSQTAAAVETENTARRLSSTEDDLAEAKSELERCRSRQLAPPPAVAAAVAHASPVEMGSVLRADVGTLARADAGTVLRADAAAPMRAVADGLTTTEAGGPMQGFSESGDADTAETSNRDSR
jgi:hypothetical protein